MSTRRFESVQDRALDSQLALSLIGRDAPNDLIVNRDFITRLGNLCDASFVRKLNMSFNPVKSLHGIDQLPQLRSLLAYACQLEKIEQLKALTKIEGVFLQQNRISSMADSFTGLNKIQELRLDQNKISKIESLSGCVNLRKLDVSFNNLEALSGLNGLQNLRELKVSNNSIKTLTHLKALPSIKELDVSNNQIRTLNGLNQLPTLEVLRADHNFIAELKIAPMHGVSTKRSENSKKVAADVKQVANAKGGVRKKGVLTSGTSSVNTTGALSELSGPCLSELSLSGNRIRSVVGLETFKDCLEVVDISCNNLTSDSIEATITILAQLGKLDELRIHSNPCANDDPAMAQVVASLSLACPQLRAIDALAIIPGSGGSSNASAMGSYKAALSGLDAAAAAPGAGAGKSNTIAGGGASRSVGEGDSAHVVATNGEFHTWNDDATTVDPRNDPLLHQESKEDETLLSDGDEDDDDDDTEDEDDWTGKKKSKKKKKSDKASVKSEPESDGVKRFPENLMLQTMLSPEEIEAKESEIRHIFEYCHNALERATSSALVDEGAQADEEWVEKEEKEKEDEPPAPLVKADSESGMRVAAAIEQQQQQQLAINSTTTTGSGSGKLLMKEKLVDRVRQAVSGQQMGGGGGGGGDADDDADVMVGIAAAIPNTALLSDDPRGSFNLQPQLGQEQRQSNSQQRSHLPASSSTSSAASPSSMSTGVKATTTTATASAVSKSGGAPDGSPSTTHTANTTTTTIDSSAKRSDSKVAASASGVTGIRGGGGGGARGAMLGSGLTRHGTRAKPWMSSSNTAASTSSDSNNNNLVLSTFSELTSPTSPSVNPAAAAAAAATGGAAGAGTLTGQQQQLEERIAPVFASEVSMLRAAGSDVESLQMMSLKIKKPSQQHVFMSELRPSAADTPGASTVANTLKEDEGEEANAAATTSSPAYAITDPSPLAEAREAAAAMTAAFSPTTAAREGELHPRGDIDGVIGRTIPESWREGIDEEEDSMGLVDPAEAAAGEGGGGGSPYKAPVIVPSNDRFGHAAGFDARSARGRGAVEATISTNPTVVAAEAAGESITTTTTTTSPVACTAATVTANQLMNNEHQRVALLKPHDVKQRPRSSSGTNKVVDSRSAALSLLLSELEKNSSATVANGIPALPSPATIGAAAVCSALPSYQPVLLSTNVAAITPGSVSPRPHSSSSSSFSSSSAVAIKAVGGRGTTTTNNNNNNNSSSNRSVGRKSSSSTSDLATALNADAAGAINSGVPLPPSSLKFQIPSSAKNAINNSSYLGNESRSGLDDEGKENAQPATTAAAAAAAAVVVAGCASGSSIAAGACGETTNNTAWSGNGLSVLEADVLSRSKKGHRIGESENPLRIPPSMVSAPFSLSDRSDNQS